MPRGRYLYQGWTKSLICLNWTMVPINERLSRGGQDPLVNLTYWTKFSMLCLDFYRLRDEVINYNLWLIQVTECDYRVLFEFCTRYTRFFLLPEGELSEILPMVKLLEYTQSKNRPSNSGSYRICVINTLMKNQLPDPFTPFN
ncbi:hypothetical protein VNO77_18457 [Canavalia gladiata]|uniref:Uncharacterized protein n=1 Tax=Canavalia gladiata TaxID=3824 RepID=A0AAN9LPB3_CANGL